MSRAAITHVKLAVIACRIFVLMFLSAVVFHGAQAQDDAPAAAAPVVVKQVQEKNLRRQLPMSGRVHSRNDVELSITIAGELHAVAEPGTVAERGEIVASLDEQPILLRRKELEIRAAREQVNLAYLGKEWQRLQKLRKTNSVSQGMLDEAESKRDMSKSDLAVIRLQIRQVEDELRRSKVVAKFAGTVVERQLKAGEYVQPGDVILRLVDVNHLEVHFEVPVNYQGRVVVGDTIAFRHRVDGALEGKVRTIIPAVDENSQSFEVRADIVGELASLGVAVGQLIGVSLSIAGGNIALMIPRDAVVLRAEGSYVFRITQDNTAEKVIVQLGEGERDWVSVTGRLRRGDWVAVRGVERLEEGQAVVRAES